MTIGEAIKENTDLKAYFQYSHSRSKLSLSAIQTYILAIQLGIEALESLKWLDEQGIKRSKLPSEKEKME